MSVPSCCETTSEASRGAPPGGRTLSGLKGEFLEIYNAGSNAADMTGASPIRMQSDQRGSLKSGYWRNCSRSSVPG